MGNFAFKPATREMIWMLIGLAGGTGSGKTRSAMRLATGMSGGKRFAVIDTERGRAKHYADDFAFDHCEINEPFRPAAYIEAVEAAAKAGYPVIVVDSTSHVWAGDGGILDWHEEELERMAGDNWQKRESCNMAAWIKPKMEHKKFVQKLLQVNAHVILCFRAEPKIEMVKEGGKTKIVPKESLIGYAGWIPVCEKNLPFELTVSFMLTADQPGLPKPIKLQEQHKAFFPLDSLINEEAGERIAEWARGGVQSTPAQLVDRGREVAKEGMKKLQAWWTGLTPAAQATVRQVMGSTDRGCPAELKSTATIADKSAATPAGATDLAGSPVPTYATLEERVRKATTPEQLDAILQDAMHLPGAELRKEIGDLATAAREKLGVPA